MNGSFSPSTDAIDQCRRPSSLEITPGHGRATEKNSAVRPIWSKTRDGSHHLPEPNPESREPKAPHGSAGRHGACRATLARRRARKKPWTKSGLLQPRADRPPTYSRSRSSLRQVGTDREVAIHRGTTRHYRQSVGQGGGRSYSTSRRAPRAGWPGSGCAVGPARKGEGQRSGQVQSIAVAKPETPMTPPRETHRVRGIVRQGAGPRARWLSSGPCRRFRHQSATGSRCSTSSTLCPSS